MNAQREAPRPDGTEPTDLRDVLALLVDLPPRWLATVALAALVSVVDVTVPHDGAWSLALRVSTITLWVLVIAWLPSLLRIVAALVKSVKVAGVEVASDGLSALLARRSPALAGTVDASVQQPAGDAGAAPPPDPGITGTRGDRPAWTDRRGALYAANHDLFLAHTLRPSNRANQKYDVAVYLVGHGADPTDVVESAEFYLGRSWGHRLFRSANTGPKTKIGMTTACHGPFLCLCRIVLKDTGEEVFLSRYVDWEMAWVFDAARDVKVAAAA